MGRYEGVPVTEWLNDGRRIKMREPFAFIDDENLKWDVPANAIVDGASIPRMLWSLIGGPFEGKYRDASIIHDWYCDRRSRPWQAVHHMFFQAMIASGVGLGRAKLLYASVYMGGPRWSETVISNANLMADDDLAGSGRAPPGGPSLPQGGDVMIKRVYRYDLNEADLATLKNSLRATSTLDDIEANIDAFTENMPQITLSEHSEKLTG